MRTPRGDQTVGSTLSTVRALAPSLGPSQRRVAGVVLAAPTSSAVSEHAGTSTATVIRACQSLGFSGFEQLKLLLVRDLSATDTPPKQSAKVSDNARLLRAFVAATAADCACALAPLNEGELGRATDVLGSADRVLVVSNRDSGSAPAAVATRFTRGGRPADAPTDAVLLHLAARRLTSRDVCLALSDSDMSWATVRPVVTAARTAGAQVIGVSGYAGSTLLELSDIGLVIGSGTGPGGGAEARSSVIQIAFLISLQIAVCHPRAVRPAVRVGDDTRVAGRERGVARCDDDVASPARCRCRRYRCCPRGQDCPSAPEYWVVRSWPCVRVASDQPYYRSSTSRSDRARDTQSMIDTLCSRSLADSTESR
ncbi:MurR/RpiR family transcriptional regulator [Rhodococcus sp. T2V]|uniref:MurR/RpiR family transcriptional regulator n=1 Tax=Rhodococcus sp. T2V TaxID=3034164 RepID=UPI0034E27702